MSFWHIFELQDDLEDQLTQAQADRADADPTEGLDSALYEAMDYRRKSGLTRKRNTPTTTS